MLRGWRKGMPAHNILNRLHWTASRPRLAAVISAGGHPGLFRASYEVERAASRGRLAVRYLHAYSDAGGCVKHLKRGPRVEGGSNAFLFGTTVEAPLPARASRGGEGVTWKMRLLGGADFAWPMIANLGDSEDQEQFFV